MPRIVRQPRAAVKNSLLGNGGTRRDEAFRASQHAWYQVELAARDVRYVIAGGPLDQRVRQLKGVLAVPSR